jgi:hypothetical protein
MSSDFLGRIVSALEAASIPHMVVGSFASTFHGVPRATHDIDIVVEADRAKLDRLLAALPDQLYYLDHDAAREALTLRSQFNVIDMATGWKADLIVRKARPYSIEELARRQPAMLMGIATFVASAEDVIISKLEWAKLGSSERQLQDAAGVVKTCAGDLDTTYIEHWVDALDLREQWALARA